MALGFDACALTDLFALARDVYDRLQAPRLLHASTRYADQRHHRLEPRRIDALFDYPSERDPSHSQAQLASRALLEKHPSLLESDRKRTVSTLIKLALRRDKYQDICRQISQYQNDEFIERIILEQAQAEHNFREHDIRLQLKPCRNITGALRLLKCPHVELDDIAAEPHLYQPIFLNSPNGPKPRWGKAPLAPPLFADQLARHRFDTLLAVVISFAVAHSSKWYHTRLSPNNIVIPTSLTSTKPRSAPEDPHFIKVLRFHCPRTGCRACTNCFSVQHNCPLADSHTFAPTNHMRPERIDLFSVANFIMWLYSEHCIVESSPFFDTPNEPNLNHVPWPLRFIVVNHASLNISTILLYLRALQLSKIDPHDLRNPLCPLPPRAAANPPSSPSSQEATLHTCCVSSVIVGAQTEEPEAIIHLARYWETCAKIPANYCTSLLPQVSEQEALQRAYDCYLSAANLGSAQALLHVARLQALNYESPALQFQPQCTVEDIMCLLLESASRGCNDAYLVLTRIPDVGLCNAMLNVAPLPMISRPSVERTQSLQHDRLVAERDLLDAVTVIGRCWRVGHRELRQDNDLATAWLRIASERMHPGASLQLGIHLVQIAESLDEVLAGIDILVKVVNVAPCPEAYEAAHRLGRYHHYGLPHEFCNSGFASDANDDEGCLRCPEKALYYIKMAAEGGVRDAMLLYSRLYRAGTPCLKQDEERAVEWEQRSGGATAFGYYLTGIARIKDARDDYREMHQRNKEKFERTISECSSTRSASFAEAKKKEKRTWGISSLGGIFNNGDKSNSSLTLEGKIREGFVDSEGNVTRAGIAQKFKVGTCYLLRGGAQVKESRPDEWCNPYPLLMAGQLMIQYRNVWAYCSADQAAAQQSFANDTFNTGVDLLNKAGYLMDNEPEWSKLRIDYRQEDLFIMRKARRQLDLLGPEGME